MPKVTLKTLSPVHIGSGNFLQKNIEFIRRQEDNLTLAGVVDPKKVFDIVGEDGINEWVSIIDKGDDLMAYLEKRKSGIKLEEICQRVIEIDAEMRDFISLKEHIHDGNGKPYIPGSSLKGALRSGIFSREMRYGGHRVSSAKVFSNQKNGKIATARFLENELFGEDPKVDVFRFLHIGDAFFEKEDTLALNLKSLNIVREGEKVILYNKVQQLVETLDAGIEVPLEMKINNQLLAYNNEKGRINKSPTWLSGLKAFFSQVNENTRELLEDEISFWEKDENTEVVAEYLERLKEIYNMVGDCSEEECITRVGHGVGWSFINGGWIKKDELVSDDLYEEIVAKTRPKNDKYRDYSFPKTRRVVEDLDVLGFVKLILK